MKIVVDIGGTHVRFAHVVGNKPQHIRKYAAADFSSLSDALAQCCKECGINDPGELLIAAAGARQAGHWIVTNNSSWMIDEDALHDQGWCISLMLNDFEAAAYSLPILQDHDLKTLKTGNRSGDLCLIGAGTGLGLAYYRDGRVQKTHGGHMPIASLNDEHGKVIKEIRATSECAVVFEDIVSGAGLQKLHDLYDEEKALRLFHEFLGIFTATALVSGHAYGELYLTGGVIEGLMVVCKFNFDTFCKFLYFNAVTCVAEDIRGTAIYYITDPYPALKGLLNAKSISNH